MNSTMGKMSFFDETLSPLVLHTYPIGVVCVRTKGVAQGQSTLQNPSRQTLARSRPSVGLLSRKGTIISVGLRYRCCKAYNGRVMVA